MTRRWRGLKLCKAALGVASVWLLGAGISLGGPGRAWAEDPAEKHGELLTGYHLLASSIGAETNLEYLLWLRELALQGPEAEVKRLVEEIAEASKKRMSELEEMRRLSPAATDDPPPSPLGDAITAAAKWEGTKEMLFPDGQFGMRFVFLQAQATRMITVIAEQTAKVDPNERRQKWLADVAKQYADFREQLVKAVEKCEPR